jgi:hypothetical protein
MILRTRFGINCNPTKANSKLYRMRNRWRQSELLYQHFVFDLFKFVPYMTEFLYLFEKSKKPVEEILSRLQRTLDDFDVKQRALTQKFQATQQKIQQEQERQKTQAKPKTYDQIIDAYSTF